jgi:hypothetical protein
MAVPAVPDAPVAEAPPVANDTYPDLTAALKATIPADARVIGFGEFHMRTDRAQVKSTLARFTEALPAIADNTSDLIVETWTLDGKCQQKAAVATAKVEATVKRPVETKNDIAILAEAARNAKIQPHAMKITCDDYDKITPKDKDWDPSYLLQLTTKELGRIAQEAVSHRDRMKDPRHFITLYGGAMHNDRFPGKGVEDWSYAAKVDGLTKDHFVEVDLIVPELAEADKKNQEAQPWYPLVDHADDKVHVFKRGDRSFVIVLQKDQKGS